MRQTKTHVEAIVIAKMEGDEKMNNINIQHNCLAHIQQEYRNVSLHLSIMRIQSAAILALTSVTSAFVVTPQPTSSVALHAAPGSLGTGEGWIDPSAPVGSAASLKLTLQKSLEGCENFTKRLSLLGSTGSIGTQTLEIVDACPDNFVVDALSAGTNVELFTKQVLRYKPKVASLATAEAAAELKERLVAAGCTEMPEIVFGDEGILEAATVSSADTVVTGIVGAAGLKPTIEAIKLKKDIALANKETLISGGPVINPLVEEYGVGMVRRTPGNFLCIHFSLTHSLYNTAPRRLRAQCHLSVFAGRPGRSSASHHSYRLGWGLSGFLQRRIVPLVPRRSTHDPGQGHHSSQLGYGGQNYSRQCHHDE